MLRKTGKTALFIAALALVASLFFVSCDNDVFGTNKPIDMTLSSTLMQYDSFSEIEGKILELEASVTLKSGAVSKDILWDIPTDTSAFKMYSSSNGKLVFEILKPGTYTVTASCSYDGTLNYKQVSCIIKTKDELTDLYIYNDATKYAFTAGSTISLTKDDSIVLAAGFNPEGTTQKNVLWSLDSTGVAELSINEKTGLATIKGTAMGTATLTLSSRDNTSISTSLKVSVQDSGADQSAGPSVITLAVPKPTVEIGKTSQINATVKDSHGNTITDGTVEFSLDNDAAKAFSVKVNSSRVATVTAVKGGAGYLTATYKFTGSDGKEASITAKAYISVEGYVKSIGTDSGYLSLYKGTAETVAVSYNPTSTTQTGYKATVSNSDIVWINEDASSDNELQILAGDVGTATVTLTSIHDSSVSTTFNVKVSEIVSAASRVKRVVIGKSSLTINPRSGYSSSSSAYDPVTLYASIFTIEDNGSETKNSRNYEIRFESSDNSIVEATNTSFFSSENGYSATLVAKKPGTAVIRAVSKDNPDAYAECTVTVGGELQGVVASRTAFNLTIGTSETITLTPNPLNAVCDIPVVSTSTDCVSAEIEKKNNIYYVKVTGNRLGTSMISFRNGNTLLTTVTVTVTEKEQVTARSLAFSGIYGSVYFAQDDSPITFKVNALDKDGKVINKNVLFKGRTTTAGQVTSLTSLGNNSFRISPKNAGSGDWIFYLEDSSVQSTLHVEVGGSAVQGTEARKIVAPTSAISLSLAATGKKNTTVTLSTIPLGTEASAGTVTWSASNDNVSVSRRGTGTQSYTATISALKAGSSIIKAETDTGLKTEISVTVYDSESASDTTIAKAEIVSGSSSGWNRYTAAGKTFDLTAKAYYADGTEVKGELFTWTYSGDSITTKNAESSKGVLKDAAVGATFMTTKLSSYDKPATITARSVSNPKVYAVFKVYVVADEPTEETAFITAEYSGVTLALESEDNKSSSMEIGYTIQPVTYNASGLTVNSTSNCVKADLNTKSKKLKLTALSEGEAVVTVTDGTLSFSVDVTVVKAAQKQDASITALTLDRTYLSYDLADKEQQAITATVYKNGSPDTTEKVVWKSSDESIVKITSVGNIAYVIPQDKVGSAYIIATSESNKLVNAVCNVEVIDSSLLEKTLRSISLSESAVTLTPGAEIMLTVTGQPEGALENVKLTWTTSDKTVAEVDKNGLVKAAGNGTAKITVSTAVNGKTLSSSCIVTVREDEVVTRVPSFITLSDSIVRVTQEQMDEVFTLHATVYDQYYEEIWGSSVLWTVENTGDIITYEKDALTLEYSPKNAGTAVVKASVGTVEAEARIIVSVGKGSDKTLKSIVISAPSTLKTNESGTITATTIPADAEDALIWTSSDSAMTLEPSNNGRTVTAKASKAGTYTVTAKSFENETITASKVITVSDAVAADKVTGVKLDARSIVLDLADKNMTVVNATVYKGGKTSDGKVAWSVDDSLKNAITVRESGNSIYITKVSKGSGYITAKAVDDASVSAVCYVEVVDTSEIVVTGIEKAIISSTSLTIEEKGKHQFTVTTYPADIESSVIWSSSDESIATIDADGLLTAVKPGKCEITAVVHGGDNTITLTCNVYVYEKTTERKDNVTVARIEFDKSAVLLSQEKMDETVEVNATVYGSDGNVYKTGDDEEAVVTWILENKSIATLTYQNNKAVLSPKSAGNGYLTAMYKGRSNSILVVTGTAEEADTSAKALKFSPETLTLKVGGTTTVTALVEPSGADAEYAFSITEGSDVISASYSKNSIRITGKKAGVAKIKAILVNKPEITAELEVKVLESTAGVVTAITLDKSFISMELDTKDLTTVTATAYVDGKVSKDAQLAWSLEDITTAEVGYTVLGSNTVSLTKKAVGSGYLVCKAVGNEDVYAKCRIEIKEAPAEADVESIALSDRELTLRIGEAYEMKTAFIPATAEAEITWKSSDAAIARVSDNGIITGVAKGTATITASVLKRDGDVVKAEAVVTVVENQGEVIPGSIRLSSYSIELSQKEPDKSKTVTATVIATDGYPVEGAVVTWTLENEDVVTKTIDGNAITLLPADAGTTTLRAWYGNLVSSASVYTSVKPGTTLDHLTTVPNSNIAVQTGTEQSVEVRTYPVGLTITPEWTSDDNAVATVTKNGDMTATVKGIKQGDAVVTVKDIGTGLSTELNVRVRDDIKNVITAVVLDKTAISFDLAEKSMANVSASVYVNNTLTTDGITLEWEVLNEDGTAREDLLTVVPVNAAKSRVALAPKGETGRAYLRATASNGTDTNYAQVYVEVVDSSTTPVKITELRCETDAATLPLGSSRTYSTITTPSGIDADIRWEIVNQNPEEGYTNVLTMDAYGSVTAVGLGEAVIKAYVYGSTPEVSDTMKITVVKIDNTKPDSQWEIGSIQLSPARITLEQDAEFPTAVTATIYDKQGEELKNETVDWNTEGLTVDGKVIAKVVKTEGNTVYLEGVNAGKGELIASRQSSDGTIKSASAYVVTGGIVTYDEEHITALSFNTSSPQYLVAGDGKKVVSSLEYTPASMKEKGVAWTSSNAVGYINYATSADGITAEGLKATESGKDAELTAVSVGTTEEGTALEAKQAYRVVATVDDLPSATSLKLDKTSIVFNIAEKNMVVVTATAYDYYGNEVPTAVIQWEIVDETTEDLVGITKLVGASTGVRRGTVTGTATLRASLMNGTEVVAVNDCYITVIDSAEFEGISASANEIRLTVGGTATVSLYGTPSSRFKGANFEVSGNTDAVEVTPDTNGKVFKISALQEGTAVVTYIAEVDGMEYTAATTVYVNSEDASGVDRISFTPASAYLEKVGDTVELTTIVYDKKANVLSENVIYKVSDPSVVDITETQTGLTVTAKKSGTASITATVGNVSAESFIMVGEENVPVDVLAKIIPAQNEIELKKNQSKDIMLVTVPEGYSMAGFTVTSSKKTVAEGAIVNGMLHITALNEGETVITVSEGEVKAEVAVKVSGVAKPAVVKFDKTGVTLTQETGSKETVTAYVYDEDMVLLEGEKIALWQTGDSAVVKIAETTDNTVTVEPLNTGSTTVTASAGTVSSSFTVTVNDVVKSATAPSSIKAAEANVQVKKGESAEISVLFEPTNITDEGKDLEWTSSNTAVATVEELSTGKAVVTGVKAGTALITAKSTKNDSAATFNVAVKNSGVYALELDKTEIRLGYGTETMLTATLTLDGEKIDAADVSWSLEGTDPAASLGFRQNNTVTNTVTGNTATLVAMTGHPAYVYVVASYDTTAARAQVEVTDISKQSTGITSVSLDKSLVRIEVGESVSFTASTLPETAGVTYEWKVAPNAEDEGAVNITGIAGNTLTVEASKVGTVDVSVTAKLAGFEDKTSDIAKIEIVEKGAMETVYKYSYVALDKSTVTMIPNGDYAIFYATLYDSENKEIEGTVSAWNVLDSRGKLLFSWEADDNGENYVWSTGASYETFDKLLEQHADCAFSRMTVVGSDNAMLEITPTKPGTYFVEVEGPVEDAENPEKTVKARAMISVTNDLTSVSLDSSVLHMILGEQITVNASLNPEDAELKSSAWMETGEITRLELTNETPESVEVRAVTLGETGIRYTAQDTIGTIRETDMKITVHDAGYGKGGIRKLAFDNVYETASYPYSTDVYTAKAYFMDGTSAESSAITYKIQHADETDLDSFESKNGMVYSTGDEEMKNGSHNGTLVATYSITESGIRITPHGKGMIKVVASYVQDEITYTAAMWLTVTGNTTTLSPSSSSIVLYTGGSTEITLTTDNNVNETYTVDLVEEYTSGGYKIVNNQLEGTTTYMPSVFTDASTGTKSGRSITIGTKAFVPETAFNDKDAETAVQVVNPKNSSASAADFYLMPGGNSITKGQWEDIRGSFPRTATFKVATADGQASSYITVTVNQLPSGNTYPVNLTLSADKVDLTPPFSTEQTVSATLTDLDGKTTKGTVDWYYYPVGREYNEVGDDGALMYKLDTKAVTGTVTGEASELIEAYFSADGLTLYYKPKQSGLYRLTAKCIQNPQLESTATLNVGGGVTGVTASAGTSLTIDKGTSAVVTAVFTPTGALARHAVFGVRETIDEKNYVKIIDDVQYENNYISVTVNKGEDISDTATVYGKLTTGANRQLMRVIYPQTTEYESMMKNAFESGEDIYWTISDSTMKAWKRTDGTMSAYVNEKGVQVAIQVFSYATTIDVTTPKTNYTFKVAGTTSIDPSAITGNSLNYTVTTTSDNSSSDSFSEWSWVEAKLIGEETEQVYASSVPVNADGESLYQWKDEKGNLLSDKYYTASELKELNAGGTAEGVNASSIKNYNSAKTVYRFFKGAGCSILGNDEYKDLSKTLVTSNEDCTKYYYQDGSEIIYDSVYDVQKSSDGTYFYYANGKETVVTPGTTEYNKGYLAAVAVPVKLSGLANGKLVAENGNQTFSFILNSNAVPDEPLLFKVGVGDKVLENNENGEYFDYEAKTYTPSDQRLYIGGDIQTISAGTSTLSNNGSSTQQTATGSMLSLIEGASAILTLEFNPEYTHQKEVTWSVLDGSGQMETDEYSAIPSADSSSLTFIAYKLADGLTKTINLRATSVYNSSVYCDYTIVIQCVVKNITFTAKALKQINGKGNTYVVPEYSEMADPAYPNQVSDNHIDCYDYTDVAGDGVTVDAYMIEMEPTPAYGYTFTAEIVKGSNVGRIDTTDIDESVNKFRFIPKGRVYSQYTATGEPDSLSYDVTYGDVTVKVSCDDLNYSKEFTINYGAAAGRLVREIDAPFAEYGDGKKMWEHVWDVADVGGISYLYGLNAIVMYEGESFPVTMVDYDNGRKGSSLIHWSTDTNMATNSAMMWYVADGNGNVCLDGSSYYTTSDASKGTGNPVWTSETAKKAFDWNGGLVYSVANGRGDDPRVAKNSKGDVIKKSGEEYTGLYGTVCTLTAKKQGIYTLYYSYISVLTDDDGTPITDTTGRAACIVTKGSIPVYVISKVSQTLISAVNSLYKTSTGKTAFSFIKEDVSKTNLDKWYLPGVDNIVGDETNQGNLDRGVTYLVFDDSHDYTANANIGKYYTGIHQLQYNNGALDFSSLNKDQFANSFLDKQTVRGIDGEPVTITGMATSAVNESGRETKEFSQAKFEELVFTGENGLALFSAINSFVAGPYTGQTDASENVKVGNWLQNNIAGTAALDFSNDNIQTITFKNLDFEDTEELLLSKKLVSLNMQNITYPAGTIKIGDIALGSDTVKTIGNTENPGTLNFSNYYTKNLEINNVEGIKSLTLNGAVGIENEKGTILSIKNLNGGKNGTAINWPGSNSLYLYFETITLENEHFSAITLEKLNNTKTITLKDISVDGKIKISGNRLTTVILDNVNAAGIEISGDNITDIVITNCTSTDNVSVIGASIINATVNGLDLGDKKKNVTLSCGAAENVTISNLKTGGNANISGGVTLNKSPVLNITSSTMDKLTVGVVYKDVSTAYAQGFSKIAIGANTSIRQIDIEAINNKSLSRKLATVTIQNVDNCQNIAVKNATSLESLSCSNIAALTTVNLYGTGSINSTDISFTNCGNSSYSGMTISNDEGAAKTFTFKNVKLASGTPISVTANTVTLTEAITPYSNSRTMSFGGSIKTLSIEQANMTIGTLSLTSGTVRNLKINGGSNKTTIGTIDMTKVNVNGFDITNTQTIDISKITLTSATMASESVLQTAVNTAETVNADGAKITSTKTSNTLSLSGGKCTSLSLDGIKFGTTVNAASMTEIANNNEGIMTAGEDPFYMYLTVYDGDSCIVDTTVDTNTSYTLPGARDTSKTFSGWSVNGSSSLYQAGARVTISTDTTIRAVYSSELPQTIDISISGLTYLNVSNNSLKRLIVSADKLTTIKFENNSGLGSGYVKINSFEYNNTSWANATSCPAYTYGSGCKIVWQYSENADRGMHENWKEITEFKLGYGIDENTILTSGTCSSGFWDINPLHGDRHQKTYIKIGNAEAGYSKTTWCERRNDSVDVLLSKSSIGSSGANVKVYTICWYDSGQAYAGAWINITFYPFGK